MTSFRTADASDGPALRALWREVFPSATHVVPLYEQDPGRADRTFLACEGDTPVAVVYWLPRPVRGLAGTVHRVGCVSSVATLPRARGQGLVRHLLGLAAESMTEADCAWSLLFTGTPGVYPDWTVFDRVHVRGTFAAVVAPRPEWKVAEVSLAEWPLLADLHTRHNANRPLTTVRTPGDWAARVPVWYGDHQILLASHHDVPMAYAVVDWRTASVTEIAVTSDDAAVALFEAVARHAAERNLASGRLLAPPDPAVAALFDEWSIGHEQTGMARALRTDPVHIVAAPEAVHWTADYF